MTIIPTGGDDGYFVNLAQWLSDSADHFGHTCEELIQNSGLVVFMEGCSFDFHGISFRFTFGADDLGFRQTFGADDLGFG